MSNDTEFTNTYDVTESIDISYFVYLTRTRRKKKEIKKERKKERKKG